MGAANVAVGAAHAQKTLTIRNHLGLHARAATKFVKLANHFDAEIHIIKDRVSVNGKSIMGILTLVAASGTEITVAADGPDAEPAVNALSALVEGGFGEGVPLA